MKRTAAQKPERCPLGGTRPNERKTAGVNEFWECSHVDCPNRKLLTAGPPDRNPRPRFEP